MFFLFFFIFILFSNKYSNHFIHSPHGEDAYPFFA